MDSDSLQADLNSLRKLYGLLQIKGPDEQSALSETLDEDSRVLLRKLLDEAAERAFKAHIKAMADNWRSLVTSPRLVQLEESKKTETPQSSVPSFAKKSPSFNQNISEELKCLETNQEEESKMPNLPPIDTPRLRRSSTDILSRKKPSMERHFQKETQYPSAEIIPDQASEANRSMVETRNYDNESLVSSASRMTSKRKLDKKGSKVQEFSKEVDDAIRRIESLIPSLHRLAKPVQSSPKNEASNPNSAFGSSGRLNEVVTTNDQASQRIGNHSKCTTMPYYTQRWSDHSGKFEGKQDRISELRRSNMKPDSRNWEMRMLPGQINEYNGYQGQTQSQMELHKVGISLGLSTTSFEPGSRRAQPPCLPRLGFGLSPFTLLRHCYEQDILSLSSASLEPGVSSDTTSLSLGTRSVSTGNYVHRGNNFDESNESRSSSWTTVGSSSYDSPSDSFETGTSYDSENEMGSSSLRSDYKDVEYGSSEAELEPSQSGSYYSNSSSYSPDYEGDVSQTEYYRTDYRNARRRRRIGGFGRLKNKLGLIFHHHHHHHHHDSAPSQGQFWNNLGKKFRGAEKGKTEALKADARGKQLARSRSRKEQIGHFHTLVEGLMRHVRRSSELELRKGGVGNLERRRLRPNKAAKRLHWWQNIGGRRGKAREAKKARLKLGGGKRRPQLKGAKKLLRYS